MYHELCQYKLKIILTNDKKQSVTEEFELKYAVSDFKVDIVTGSTEYYQGQEILYAGKIVPNKNTDTKGYTIKFNSYDGIIKFGGNPIELGKEYSITDINNLNISLSSNKLGQQKLSYTIKTVLFQEIWKFCKTIKQDYLVFQIWI